MVWAHIGGAVRYHVTRDARRPRSRLMSLDGSVGLLADPSSNEVVFFGNEVKEEEEGHTLRGA